LSCNPAAISTWLMTLSPNAPASASCCR
jgi:hypothetical protein